MLKYCLVYSVFKNWLLYHTFFSFHGIIFSLCKRVQKFGYQDYISRLAYSWEHSGKNATTGNMLFYLLFKKKLACVLLSVVGAHFVKRVNIWPTLLIRLYNWNVFNLCEMTCLIRKIFSYWKAIPISCTVTMHVSNLFICVYVAFFFFS